MQDKRPCEPTTSSAKARSWPIRAIGVLLLVQAVGLLGIGLYVGAGYSWPSLQGFPAEILSAERPEWLSIAGFLIVLATLAALASIGFFFLFNFGWLLAMIVQGLTLFFCIGLYFQHKPSFIYLLMLYSVLMVLYLNSFNVHRAFRLKLVSPRSEGPYEP